MIGKSGVDRHRRIMTIVAIDKMALRNDREANKKSNSSEYFVSLSIVSSFWEEGS